MTSQHIALAVSLSLGLPVQKILTMAMVDGLLLDNYKFSTEYREIPGFATDLLAPVRATLKTTSHGQCLTESQEHLSGEILPP